jgi:hypothetical protein
MLNFSLSTACSATKKRIRCRTCQPCCSTIFSFLLPQKDLLHQKVLLLQNLLPLQQYPVTLAAPPACLCQLLSLQATQAFLSAVVLMYGWQYAGAGHEQGPKEGCKQRCRNQAVAATTDALACSMTTMHVIRSGYCKCGAAQTAQVAFQPATGCLPQAGPAPPSSAALGRTAASQTHSPALLHYLEMCMTGTVSATVCAYV